MGKGNVLRIFDTKAVFENLDNGNCLLVTQTKDSGARQYDKFNRSHAPDLGSTSQVLPFEAIFGIYDLLSGSYVALVVESEPYVSVGGLSMRRSKKVLVIPLFRAGRVLSESRQMDEDRYLQLLHMAFSEHQFFFSFTSDITLTQQKIAKRQSRKQGGGAGHEEPIWARADHRFFWNRELVIDLISNEVDAEWIVPFMSAYVEVRTDCVIKENKFTLLFISRRSRHRQGCRFTKRGLDEHGSVANFVETEQIVFNANGNVSSYVQVRGSIPAKWCSPVHMKYDPVVYIDEDRALSVDWAERHFRELSEMYSDNFGSSSIICVNLVDNKKDQGKLGALFKEVVDEVRPRIAPTTISYVWFDFHHECKQKGKWNNLSKLVAQVDEQFRAQHFFSKLASGHVTSWQNGVIRTNCMDNLDRTNVTQSLFARRSLIIQLGLGSCAELQNNPKGLLETPWKPFEAMFKHVWANNANAMSFAYAGTGALKVDFTRTGKRTLRGMFNDGVNAVMRYYINNFTDGIKQDAIDLLLGNYRPDPTAPSPFTSKSAQDALSSNITKSFVMMMIIFSTLLLLLPPMLPLHVLHNISSTSTEGASGDSDGTRALTQEEITDIVESNLQQMRSHFLVALLITAAVGAYYAYKVTKKGTKAGERMVVHPDLCPEPLPPGRS